MKSQSLHDAFLSAGGSGPYASASAARDELYAAAEVSAHDAVLDPHPAPNYRAFCIAVLELRINATPELLTALARRYDLILDDGSENPTL